jgi:hypothetical protein
VSKLQFADPAGNGSSWRCLLVPTAGPNGSIPEGFSMRAAARRFPLALAARVDKPWKEEAAGCWVGRPMGKA